MQLHVRGLNTHILDVQPAATTIGDVKTSLATLERIVDPRKLQLTCEGKWLPDSALVSELSSMELDVMVPLAGGKVHGSLSRAGKVRSQTPKVEKNDRKRKQLTGRAKRRVQYNRRFVCQVVLPFRRRKGPNSQSV